MVGSLEPRRRSPITEIRDAIETAVRYVSEHPEEARYTDSIARARLSQALRVEVEGPGGLRVNTDMPSGVGGRGEAASPGWLFRAALASCVASTVGMEAAREGIMLRSVDVEVDSESDDHGILGMDEAIPAGPLSVRVRVRATADGVAEGVLRSVIEAGAARCPVFDATTRAVDVSLEVQSA